MIEQSEKDLKMTMKICRSYQYVLREMIYHFDPNDCFQGCFPRNYNDYIERLDYAIEAYFKNISIDESIFELQR